MDAELLRNMTEYLAFRGQDALQTHVGTSVGFGHAWHSNLDTDEPLPFVLDDRWWITADARIDGREDLIRRLRTAGRDASITESDASLIVKSYAVWGIACTHHLIGDFSFAIWDAQERRLFAARDHFGVKPFFYAQAGEAVVFGSSPGAIVRYPTVSTSLDEHFVADFLVLGHSLEHDRSVYRHVRRLPAAHSLVVQQGSVRRERYWALGLDQKTRFGTPEAYVEAFRDILQTAVQDRLRTPRVGVMLSGGMDSTSVAAVAHATLRRLYPTQGYVLAQTATKHAQVPDAEGLHAREVARHLGVDHLFQGHATHRPLDFVKQMAGKPAEEPIKSAMYSVFTACMQQFAEAEVPVVLTGIGVPDILLRQSRRWHLSRLVQTGKLGALVREAGRYAVLRLREWHLNTRTGYSPEPSEPSHLLSHLSSNFLERVNVRSRIQAKDQSPLVSGSHPVHAVPHHAIQRDDTWMFLIGDQDPNAFGFPIDIRHPFLDLRLIDFVLGLPPSPWVFEKRILRTSVQDLLPPSILRRPKAPLGAPLLESYSGPPIQSASLSRAHALGLVQSSRIQSSGIEQPALFRLLAFEQWLLPLGTLIET